MRRGEVWFASTPGGDRPVLVLTRDPVADRIGSVVVAALSRTRRGLVSELALTTADGVPTDSVVNFDNIHTVPRDRFRRRVTTLPPPRLASPRPVECSRRPRGAEPAVTNTTFRNARNPDADSTLPYVLWVPLGPTPLVVKANSASSDIGHRR
jgi:mRNA interferase MazF